jgi:hypothetical protein
MELSIDRMLGAVAIHAATLSASIFPNAVNANSSILRIQNQSGRAILRIYEMQGSLIDEKEYYTPEDYNIADKKLSKGIYFYQVLDEEGRVNGKFEIV